VRVFLGRGKQTFLEQPFQLGKVSPYESACNAHNSVADSQ
jgi:hypothetical protein